jgi:hypothetical protein
MFELFELSQSWWVRGSGTCNVPHQAVLAISKLLPPGASWVMNWPLKVLSKDIRLNEHKVPIGTNSNTVLYDLVRDDPMGKFNTAGAA